MTRRALSITPPRSQQRLRGQEKSSRQAYFFILSDPVNRVLSSLPCFTPQEYYDNPIRIISILTFRYPDKNKEKPYRMPASNWDVENG